MWSVGPINPTPAEERILTAYFGFTNKILPAVDEAVFRAALAAAKGAGGAGGGSDGTVLAPDESPVRAVRRHAELFGFRVCYFTLLCVGSRIAGNAPAARRYYELARAYIGPVYAQPSQHLVSALLLMTMISRAMCHDAAQAALHAALALRMSELVEVRWLRGEGGWNVAAGARGGTCAPRAPPTEANADTTAVLVRAPCR